MRIALRVSHPHTSCADYIWISQQLLLTLPPLYIPIRTRRRSPLAILERPAPSHK